jgi:hypothetical protein
VGLLWKLLWFYRHPHLIHVAALCSSFYTPNHSLRTDCTNGRFSSEMVVFLPKRVRKCRCTVLMEFVFANSNIQYAFCWSVAILPH